MVAELRRRLSLFRTLDLGTFLVARLALRLGKLADFDRTLDPFFSVRTTMVL
jgi:hypothetical protein